MKKGVEVECACTPLVSVVLRLVSDATIPQLPIRDQGAEASAVKDRVLGSFKVRTSDALDTDSWYGTCKRVGSCQC